MESSRSIRPTIGARCLASRYDMAGAPAWRPTSMCRLDPSGPADGATVAGSADVRIVASDEGAIAEVSFLVDGTRRCVTTSGTLVCQWRTAKIPIGSHTLTAVALDGSGNRSSQTITVTVQR